jgi:hypothetical protein
MAELLGVISGGLGIVSCALEVSDKIIQIKRFLDAVKTAPIEIRLQLEEIELLNEILLDFDAQNPAAFDDRISRRCAQHCRRATELVSELLDDIQSKIGKRKTLGAIEFALKRHDLERLLRRLESIKSTLSMAHLVGQRQQQLFIRQLAERQSEAMQSLSTIVSSTQSHSDTKENTAFASSSSSYSLAKVRRRTSSKPALRLALPLALSGKVWEFYTAKAQNEWAFRFRTYNIISESLLIFEYAEKGNVDGLKSLLQCNQASVFDCDDTGRTVLHVSYLNRPFSD